MTPKRVKRIVTSMSEHKFVNYAIGTRAAGNAIVASWGVLSFLNGPAGTTGIPIGTTASTRIGNKIRLVSIKYSFVFLPVATMDASGGNNCRFVIYRNNQCNGTLVSAADAFVSNQTTSPRNVNNLKKISILRDSIMTMVPTSGTTMGPAYPITGTIYPKSVVTYTGTAATIADILMKDWGFMVIADAASCCEYYGEWQLNFTDA